MAKNYSLLLKKTFFLILLFFAFNTNAQTIVTYTTTASAAGNYTFTVPCEVTSITVEIWGAGGGGGGTSANPSYGSGGAGGSYAKQTFTVSGGTVYNLTVGAGGVAGSSTGGNGGAGSSSFFGNTTTGVSTGATCLAVGGAGGNGNLAGAGTAAGSTTGNIGSLFYAGGNGSAFSGANSGAGGGGAGSGSVGGNASGITAGTGGTGTYVGGIGAAGRTTAGAGNAGTAPGGGGGGGFRNSTTTRTGGAGGAGKVVISYLGTSYCAVTGTTTVEPITNVTFAGINNTSSGTTGGTNYVETFRGLGCSTPIQQGLTYPISVSGNTNGAWTNYIRVYIDWNQNGSFADAGESFDIGTIYNSTAGTVTNNILVPCTATTGITRMRVIKSFNAYTSSSCTESSTYGQTEDYMITISAGSSEVYSSSTVTQNNIATVAPAATNAEIIAIPIVISGGCSPTLNATSFTLNTTGTTSTTDISNAKIWYTGTSSTFAATTQFGSTNATPSGTYTITGSQSLLGGTNYFWLTYDITAGATANNVVDAQCTSLIVGGTTYTPTVTNPTGTRTILGLKNWIGAGVSGGTSGTDFNTATNWSPTGVPTSTDEAVITTTTAATITLSANATIGKLTVLNNGNVQLALDVQTNTLTVQGNSSFNCFTAGTLLSSLSIRVGNSPGQIIFNGDADFGPNASASPYIGFEGSAAGTTTGSVTFNGNTTFSVTYATLTGSIGTFIWDKNGSQTISTNPTYAIGFPGNCQIGGVNAPTVSISTLTATGILSGGAAANGLTIKAGATLDLASKTWNKSTTAPSAAGGTLTLEAGATLKLGGTTGGQTGSNFPLNFTTASPSLATTSTVEYNAGTQTIYATPTYGNLTLTASGTKTAGGTLTIAGNLTVNNSATFAAAANTVTLGGNFSNAGTYTHTAANSFVFNKIGDQTVSGSGSFAFPIVTLNKSVLANKVICSSTVTIAAGGIIYTAGTWEQSAGTMSFTSGNQTMSSAAGKLMTSGSGSISFQSSAIVSGGTLLMNSTGTLTIGGSGNRLEIAGGTVQLSAGTVNVGARIGGASNLSTGGTLIIDGATVNAPTTLLSNSTSGVFAIGSPTTFSMTSGTLNILTANQGTFTGNDVEIQAGTISGGTIALGSASPGTQNFIVNIPINTNNITVNTGSNIVQLVGNNLTLGNSGILSLLSGNIDGATNSLDVIVTNSASGAVTQSGTGYINHNLKRAVATTGTNYFYPIGLSATADYTPITLNFTNLTAGDLKIKANSGDQTNLGTSGINSAKNVNAYWTLTGTAGAASTNYAGTLAYTSGLNDDVSVVANYKIGKYNSGWTYPTVNGTPSTTSGLFTAASGFGDIVIGDCKTPTASANPDTTTTCRNGNASFTITGSSGATVSYNINGGSTATTVLTGGTANVTATGVSGTTTLNLTSVIYSGSSCSAISLSDSDAITIGPNVWTGGTGNWNVAGNWSCGFIPTIVDDIQIATGNVTIPVDSNAKSLTMTGTATAVVNSGITLTTDNNLNIAGTTSLTFNDTASLLQNNSATANVGSINYKRNTSNINNNYDFVYWGSPVANHTLTNMWMTTANDTFYYYDPTMVVTDVMEGWIYAAPSTAMITAKGYISRAYLGSTGWTTLATPYSSTFTGVPINGSQTIIIQKNGSFIDNLIANPYPSAIDFEALVDDTDNANVLTGNAYFWSHYTAYTGVYTSDDYTVYNATIGAGVGTGQASISNPSGGAPDKNIDAAQGFFVEADAGGTLNFKNAYRVSGNNNGFYRNANNKKSNRPESDKIWLNLTNNQGAFKQQLLAYVSGSTNGFDNKYDAKSFDGNSFIDFYSIIATNKLVIQSRPTLIDNDLVPLGYKSSIKGNFDISIDHFDGKFVGKTVYLQDNLLDIDYNLSEKPYNFNTEIGTFNDRFILKYQSYLSNPPADGILIANNNPALNIKSLTENIESIQIFDVLGRNIYEKSNIKSKNFIETNLSLSNQSLIVKITLANGNTISRKIVY